MSVILGVLDVDGLMVRDKTSGGLFFVDLLILRVWLLFAQMMDALTCHLEENLMLNTEQFVIIKFLWIQGENLHGLKNTMLRFKLKSIRIQLKVIEGVLNRISRLREV